MLSVSSSQKTTILDPLDTPLQQAFSDGVGVASVRFLEAIQKYTDLTPEQQLLVKDTFKLVVAAMLVTMNVKAPLPNVITDGGGITGTFSFQDNLGANRQIVIQNGLIVGTT